MTENSQALFNLIQQCRYGYLMFNKHDWAIGQALMAYGEWAEDEMKLMAPFISPGDVIVDVGANLGAHTLFFARMVGVEGHVHSFEPQRIIFQTLCGNVALNSLLNVTCYPFGLGNRHKILSIKPIDYQDVNNHGMTRLEDDSDYNESVEVRTLDSVLLKRCDLIKIDVEGMEKEVLEGAYRTIQAFRPVLYMENNQPDKTPALLEYIKSLNYKIHQHIVPAFNPDNFLGNPTDITNGYLESNILCLPAEKVEAYGLIALPVL